MDEFIKRKAVIDLITRRYENPEICTKEISSIPAADVAPVQHGKWLYGDYYDIGDVCSECDWDSKMTHPSYRYCPNCGAKMDGGED